MESVCKFLNNRIQELNSKESQGVTYSALASYSELESHFLILEVCKSITRESNTGFERYFHTLNQWKLPKNGMESCLVNEEVYPFERKKIENIKEPSSVFDSIAFVKDNSFASFVVNDGFTAVKEGFLTKCMNVGVLTGPGSFNFSLPFDQLLHRPKCGIPFCCHMFLCYKNEFPDNKDIIEGFYDAFMLSGSINSCLSGKEWIELLTEKIRFIHEESLAKIVGVCFGHQVVAKAFGGIVEKNPNGFEFGFRKVHFEGSGQKFIEALAHKGVFGCKYESSYLIPHAPFDEAKPLNDNDDEKTANRTEIDFSEVASNEMRICLTHFDRVAPGGEPEGWTVYCGNEMTPVQGLYYDRILTMQFHPEFHYSHWEEFLRIFTTKLPHVVPSDVEDTFALPVANEIMAKAIVGFITMDPTTRFE